MSSYVMDEWFTLAQQKTMALVPKFSAGLSLPSSIFLIYEALNDHRQGRGSPIHRALIGMSCLDCLSSFGYLMSNWFVPEGFVWGSVGNMSTCNFQGFAVLVACGPPMFNTAIVVFCLLMIKYRWTDSRIARIEPWIYVFILAWAIVGPLLAIFLNLINPVGVICWPAEEWGCYGGINVETGEACPNAHQQYAWIYVVVIFYVPIYASFLIITVCLGMIYFEVRNTHRRLMKHSFTHSMTRSDNSGDGISHLRRSQVNASSAGSHAQGRSGNDVKRIGTKAALYSLAFFAIFIPSTVWSFYGYAGVSPFAIIVAALLCEPLQGLWNLLIFARDRLTTRLQLLRIVTLGYCCGLAARTSSESARNNTSTASSRSQLPGQGNQPDQAEAQLGGQPSFDSGLSFANESSRQDQGLANDLEMPTNNDHDGSARRQQGDTSDGQSESFENDSINR